MWCFMQLKACFEKSCENQFFVLFEFHLLLIITVILELLPERTIYWKYGFRPDKGAGHRPSSTCWAQANLNHRNSSYAWKSVFFQEEGASLGQISGPLTMDPKSGTILLIFISFLTNFSSVGLKVVKNRR
jgi:hypothetical protein